MQFYKNRKLTVRTYWLNCAGLVASWPISWWFLHDWLFLLKFKHNPPPKSLTRNKPITSTSIVRTIIATTLVYGWLYNLLLPDYSDDLWFWLFNTACSLLLSLLYSATTTAPPSPKLCWSPRVASFTCRSPAKPLSCRLSSVHCAKPEICQQIYF